jgi:F0F1-type ATP synthase alpha subunit
MDIKSSDLVTLFEKSLTNLSQEKLEETGVVIQVGDNICKVYGLINAVYGELVCT